MFNIRRFQTIRGFELSLAITLGVISGIYIWKPVFIEAIRLNSENGGTANAAASTKTTATNSVAVTATNQIAH